MRLRSVIAVFIISILFQVTLVDYLKFFSAKPDLLLIAAFIGGLFLQLRWALAAGFILGAIKDSFLLNTLGLNAALFPLWIIFSVKLSRRVSVDDNLSRSVLVGVIALLNNIISGFFLTFSGSTVPLGIFLRIVLFSSLYTVLVCYISLRLILR